MPYRPGRRYTSQQLGREITFCCYSRFMFWIYNALIAHQSLTSHTQSTPPFSLAGEFGGFFITSLLCTLKNDTTMHSMKHASRYDYCSIVFIRFDQTIRQSISQQKCKNMQISRTTVRRRRTYQMIVKRRVTFRSWEVLGQSHNY